MFGELSICASLERSPNDIKELTNSIKVIRIILVCKLIELSN